jgi:hypothetical protein
MLKRRKLLCGLALVVLLLIWAFVLPFALPNQFGPAAYERIRLGMTESEVEEIIDMPDGDYYTGPRGFGTLGGPFGHREAQEGLPDDALPHFGWGTYVTDRGDTITLKRWWGNEYAIVVAFDAKRGAVARRLLSVCAPTSETWSLLDHLRALLRW